MAAITSPRPKWRSTRTTRSLALRVKTYANFGAYMSLFSSSVPTYLYATLLSGQYNIPDIFAEVVAVYTNTTPVDAYRGAGRPEASFVVERLMETAARQFKVDPAELRRKNFITRFPHQTPGDHGLRYRRFRALARLCDEGDRLRRLRRPQGQGKVGRQAARSRRLLLHRGLRHRAVEGGRQPRRRRRPVGVRGNPRQSGRHHRGPHGLA